MYPTAEEKELFKVHNKYTLQMQIKYSFGKVTTVTIPIWRGSCPAELSSQRFSLVLWD